jgi:EpsI family protein
MVFMFAAAGMAMAFHPTHRIADDGEKVNLETMVPKQFGNWHEIQQNAHIINPQQLEVIERIYSQTLSRSYINDAGDVIMLAIAYGTDQSEKKTQLHYPEVCYPAQGFQILSNKKGIIKTDFGDIRVKRLFAVQGNRFEPLSYWTTVGNRIVMGGNETKIEALRYGWHGQIPDGIVFRVSTITTDADAGFAIQQDFVHQIVVAMSVYARLKLAGLSEQIAKTEPIGVLRQ